MALSLQKWHFLKTGRSCHVVSFISFQRALGRVSGLRARLQKRHFHKCRFAIPQHPSAPPNFPLSIQKNEEGHHDLPPELRPCILVYRLLERGVLGRRIYSCFTSGASASSRRIYTCFPSCTAAFSLLRIFAEPTVVRFPGPLPFVLGLLPYFLLR